jgi:hypothetical protein
MSEKPSEVYHNDLVEALKINMQSIENELIQLQFHMQNGSKFINEHFSQIVDLIENAKLDAHSSPEIKMASGRMVESLKDFGQILSTRIKEYELECVETFASETNMKRLK